jgi:hypothetical protein
MSQVPYCTLREREPSWISVFNSSREDCPDNKNNNNDDDDDSIKFSIINVPSQHLQGQFQTQHNVDIGNKIKPKATE